MNRKEVGIVIGITVVIILTFAVVAFLTSGSSPIKSQSTGKRFSAEPGKTREKPLLLVSKEREDTFGKADEDGNKEETNSPVKKVYSAELGKSDEGPTSEITEGETAKGKEQVETEIPDNLKQLLEPNGDTQQMPDGTEEILNNWFNSLPSQEKKIEEIKSHLETLISKGLTAWVTERLEEISQQTQENPTVLSESQWLLAQVKQMQGDTSTAEQYYKQAWETITSSVDINDPKQEEILRLLGLNYVQFLRKQNKNTEAENVSQLVTEKLKSKSSVK